MGSRISAENVNKKEETKKKLIQKLFHVYHKMAEYLASIFGTEKDKVNCSFYFKIGACRHGDRCSRIHNKPTFSQTIVLQNLPMAHISPMLVMKRCRNIMIIFSRIVLLRQR